MAEKTGWSTYGSGDKLLRRGGANRQNKRRRRHRGGAYPKAMRSRMAESTAGDEGEGQIRWRRSWGGPDPKAAGQVRANPLSSSSLLVEGTARSGVLAGGGEGRIWRWRSRRRLNPPSLVTRETGQLRARWRRGG